MADRTNTRRRLMQVMVLVGCVLGLLGSPGASAVPISVAIMGDLADGGSYSGNMTYGDTDFNSSSDMGMFNALFNLTVIGGTATGNTIFMSGLAQRAGIESTLTPFGALGMFFVGDPVELPKFFLVWEAAPSYDPDVQPTLSDFGTFLPQFSQYTDASMNVTGVSSVALTQRSLAISEPSTLLLSMMAIGLLSGWRARDRSTLAKAPGT